ncbi:MAG: AAA family ATPase [Chloroflexi bacterium]|nr:AAA family ATPase [Chloroflexota bacterium]
MAAGLDRSIVCPVLIGREAQLTAVDELLVAAANGAGQALLLAGEAGVGKSRLTTEVAAHAAEHSFLLLRGACFEPDAVCPYAPLLDLLRAHLGGRPPATRAAALGDAAPVLAPLLPDLLPAPAAAPTLDPEQEKRRLFAALARMILDLAAGQPVLLIIEDVHWSDPTSLEFLRYLLRRIGGQRLLIVLTYRHDETRPALRHWLAGLDRERLAQEVTLSPLTRDEIGAMIRAIFGPPRSTRAAFVEAIADLTQGNPFFIEEILTSLVAAGDVMLRDGVWARQRIDRLHLPRSVHDAVHQRLLTVSAPARRLAAIAAVAGRRLDIDLLRSVAWIDEAELLAHLRELIAAQLVIEETADRIAFRHALTRQVIYAGLLARERRALHEAVAAALAAGPPDAMEMRIPDLAYHAFESEQWDQALTHGQRAAAQAARLYTPAAVVDHLGRTLAAAARLGQPPPLDLLRQRAQALDTTGDLDGALADYQAALERAQALGDRHGEWQTLLDLGLLWQARDYGQAYAHLAQALELARTSDDPAVLAHSLNRVGNWHANQEEPAVALAHHQEALVIFERLDDRPGRAATLDLIGMARALGGDLIGGSQALRQAAALFRALDDRRGLVGCLLGIEIPALYESETMVGRASLPNSLAGLERVLALARAIGWRPGEAYLLALVGMVLGAGGHFAHALTTAQAALTLAEEIDHVQWQVQALAVLSLLHRDLLAPAAERAYLEQVWSLSQAIRSPIFVNGTGAAFAAHLVRIDDLPAAERLLDDLAGPALPVQSQGHRWLWMARAELLLARGDAAGALAIVDRLYAAAPNLTAEGDIPRLALLKATALAALAQPAAAVALLQAAQVTAAAQGWRPLLWQLHAALGALLRQTGFVGAALAEEAAARALIEDLAQAAPAGDLRDGFRQVALARLPAEARPRPAERARDGLTRREREVAALITHGLTNREIAAHLSIGERTVETHVSNALLKLGFTARTQLAAWSATQGQAAGDRH